MIRLMIGRDLKSLYIRRAAPPGEVVLRDRGLRTGAFPGPARSSLASARGEILGLAGLVGAGRTELARAVFGIDRRSAVGSCSTASRRRLRRRATRSRAGSTWCPRTASAPGCCSTFRSRENIRCPISPAYAHGGIVRRGAETAQCRAAADAPRHQGALGRRPRSAALSGGNQQKVVLAKWLSMRPRVMIFDEPTRGIDVGAKSEIYALMRGLADAGVAILMISSDMEEVIGVSDRIAVMHEGAHQRLSRARRSSASTTCCGSPSARSWQRGGSACSRRTSACCPDPGRGRRRGDRSTRVSCRRSTSSNTANLIGLFGLFSHRPRPSSSSPAASSSRSARSSRCSAWSSST